MTRTISIILIVMKTIILRMEMITIRNKTIKKNNGENVASDDKLVYQDDKIDGEGGSNDEDIDDYDNTKSDNRTITWD